MARRGAPWLARVPARIKETVGGITCSFRSKLEFSIAEDLEDRGAEWAYEPGRLKYTQEHHYIPDFILQIEDMRELLIEAKGWTPGWESGADRTKMLAVREQRGVTICIVWDSANFARRPMSKGAKTTNEQWARKHKFPQASGVVPDEWLRGYFTP